MRNLLIFVEQYDVVGILPSQLESLGILARAMGIDRLAFVDGTADGVRSTDGFERFGSLEQWLEETEGRVIALDPKGDADIRDLEPGILDNAWLVFGPAMGFTGAPFGTREVDRVRIPSGVGLSARDAVPIALWELSPWRAQ